MKRISLLSIISILLFSACGTSKTEENTFAHPMALDAPDSIAIKQIIAPLVWRTIDNKAVVFSQKTDSVFFVYRLPDFEYLYSFGAKGEGPDDFSYPYLRTQNVSTSPFYLDDLNKRRRHIYRIGDREAQKTGERKSEQYNIFFYINDSVTFQVNSDYAGEYLKNYYRTTTEDGVTIDSLIPLTYYKSFKVSHDGGGIGITGRYYNEPQFVYNDGRLVILYGDVRRTDIYDILPDGHIVLKKSIGDPSTSEQINAMDLENVENGETFYGIQGTENRIYVLTGDFRKEEKGRKLLRSYVEVYDWDGNPVKKFDLARAFNRFLVDEPHGKIFCYDSAQDFDQVFVYDYKI